MADRFIRINKLPKTVYPDIKRLQEAGVLDSKLKALISFICNEGEVVVASSGNLVVNMHWEQHGNPDEVKQYIEKSTGGYIEKDDPLKHLFQYAGLNTLSFRELNGTVATSLSDVLKACNDFGVDITKTDLKIQLPNFGIDPNGRLGDIREIASNKFNTALNESRQRKITPTAESEEARIRALLAEALSNGQLWKPATAKAPYVKWQWAVPGDYTTPGKSAPSHTNFDSIRKSLGKAGADMDVGDLRNSGLRGNLTLKLSSFLRACVSRGVDLGLEDSESPLVRALGELKIEAREPQAVIEAVAAIKSYPPQTAHARSKASRPDGAMR